MDPKEENKLVTKAAFTFILWDALIFFAIGPPALLALLFLDSLIGVLIFGAALLVIIPLGPKIAAKKARSKYPSITKWSSVFAYIAIISLCITGAGPLLSVIGGTFTATQLVEPGIIALQLAFAYHYLVRV